MTSPPADVVVRMARSVDALRAIRFLAELSLLVDGYLLPVTGLMAEVSYQ